MCALSRVWDWSVADLVRRPRAAQLAKRKADDLEDFEERRQSCDSSRALRVVPLLTPFGVLQRKPFRIPTRRVRTCRQKTSPKGPPSSKRSSQHGPNGRADSRRRATSPIAKMPSLRSSSAASSRSRTASSRAGGRRRFSPRRTSPRVASGVLHLHRLHLYERRDRLFRKKLGRPFRARGISSGDGQK